MSNMSYCRFENTLADFRDCIRALKEPDSISSDSEREAARKLLREALELVECLELPEDATREDKRNAIESAVKYSSVTEEI